MVTKKKRPAPRRQRDNQAIKHKVCTPDYRPKRRPVAAVQHSGGIKFYFASAVQFGGAHAS